MAARIASTSSGVLMRRAARSAGPPSTISASGNAIGSSWANSGDMASVPTRPGRTSAAIPLSISTRFIGFQVMP